jgi:hypothetical protein
MGWVMPIDQVLLNFNRKGVFLLVDARHKRLMFFGFKKDNAEINRLIDSLKGRSDEMTKYLIALLRAGG